ncbi:DUF4145 domain-containing protein [Pseudomonas nicosulfuronedens]|uniref:DUF4145 domain-containing protein n=1 Tax=Pseudomonas nicosulfuronedens TaxID=2571105 RepID=UPI00244B2CB3|nr:DUF4145 domain-containing protein [Pseudomonas nicosulfuronedens]MDH1012476.1 DUF4145 domain-containing protein [Pseudomonas nicosulfuronedens]MDH1979981.1 DUF4145 domain-containing protein [Pseudomonas nicosulfuronedens]MDH2029919.1 DUF4145 domain-containing protein [Pseudomonas nicosulfuronedens]
MSKEYVSPSYRADSYHCPHASCGAFAHMNWVQMAHNVAVSLCDSCRQPSIWRLWVNGSIGNYETYDGELVYPKITVAPPHHPDLPADICRDYEEARLVCSHSPRAAAALLRLCVQKLCNHLLGKSGDINIQIGELVAQGLPIRAKHALDSVRVIGNESVHPGTMDLNDTPDLAIALFRLVNLIVQNCITDPREAAEIFGSLPAGKLKGIEIRDKPKA